jgi:hypothetical protein
MLLNIIEITALLGCALGLGWWLLCEIQRGIDTYDEEE